MIGISVSAMCAVEIIDGAIGLNRHGSLTRVGLGVGILAGEEIVRFDPEFDGLRAGDAQRRRISQIDLIRAALETKMQSLQFGHADADTVSAGVSHRVTQGGANRRGTGSRFVIPEKRDFHCGNAQRRGRGLFQVDIRGIAGGEVSQIKPILILLQGSLD